MTVAGICMMKDEVDVAAAVVQHMVEEAMDIIVVADNGSTDGTGEILRGLNLSGHQSSPQIVVVDDPDPAYYQSAKMTRLAGMAHDLGATWIVPFDADEIWFYPHERVGLWLETLSAEIGIVQAELFNHFCSSLDPSEGNPFQRIGWRQREPAKLLKVAFRWDANIVIAQGNHAAIGAPGEISNGLQIRHFPFRSVEHFIQKARNGAAAYAATDLPETEGAHWRQHGALLDRYGEKALEEVWDQYYHFLAPVDAGLVYDPAPYLRWQ